MAGASRSRATADAAAGSGRDAKLPVVRSCSDPDLAHAARSAGHACSSPRSPALRKELRPLVARAYSTAARDPDRAAGGPGALLRQRRPLRGQVGGGRARARRPDSSGARFIDVRLPERPAAAGSAPGSSAAGGTPAGEDTSAGSTAAAADTATTAARQARPRPRRSSIPTLNPESRVRQLSTSSPGSGGTKSCLPS